KLRKEQWLGLLSALLLALKEGGNYCIRESEFVLDPDWIWVGRDVRDIKLIAVPVIGYGSPERAYREWHALLDCLISCGLPQALGERLRPSQWESSTFSHTLWMEALEDPE